jgi:hypothetical protein
MSAHTDERPNARAREQRLGLVSRPRFEDYREKYATHFKLERRDGILQLTLHTEDGPFLLYRVDPHCGHASLVIILLSGLPSAGFWFWPSVARILRAHYLDATAKI